MKCGLSLGQAARLNSRWGAGTMKKINLIVRLVLLSAGLMFFSSHAYGSSFSCPYGKRAACLGYGEGTCPSNAKCVKNNAICFESNTCGYGGFVCESELDDLASEYDDLLDDCKSIANDHDDLVDKYNRLLRKYESTVSDYQDIEFCINRATTVDEVKSCF